jgi:hypothetical protein
VFAASFFTKVRGRAAWSSFQSWLARLPLPYVKQKTTSLAVATTEAIVVVLVIIPATAIEGLAVSAALAAVLSGGLILSLRRGSREPCHCFGTSSDPLSWQHVARNVLLLAVALAGVACSVTRSTGSPASGVAMAAFAGLAVALCVLFFTDIVALGRPVKATAVPAAHPHPNPR